MDAIDEIDMVKLLKGSGLDKPMRKCLASFAAKRLDPTEDVYQFFAILGWKREKIITKQYIADGNKEQLWDGHWRFFNKHHEVSFVVNTSRIDPMSVVTI